MFSHSFPFDPSYGYSLPALMRVPSADPPGDFEAFWRATFQEALTTAIDPEMRPSAERVAGFEVFDIAYTSLGGVRIRGWLTIPRDGPVTRGLVISHGYGGRNEPDSEPLLPDAAMIFPCARGMSRSRWAGMPHESQGHVLHGLESRETYSHRGCAADVWLAASALIALVPAAARRLDYVGGSFGGGIGALALPWDDRFVRAYLGVPSFGPHPLRLALPCVGSGEAVRRYVARHPEAIQVLRYFDASSAARFIRIPTLVGAALFDPAVPPPGQFAIYNALAGPKELRVRPAAHFDYPAGLEDDRADRAAIRRFFSEVKA